MASPQTVNGFVSIANEIFEALARKKIPASARQVLDVIFRKTYGWNKLTDTISISQFSKATGICKRNIIVAPRTGAWIETMWSRWHS
jgi:phage replication O-like protein O